MNELDVRKSLETIRFADGGRNENNVYIQDYDGYRLAVIRDGDGKEVEIEAENIGNLIKALEQAKEYFSESYEKSNRETAIDDFERGVFETLFGMNQNWIRHDDRGCPVHPMDVVEIINDLGGKGVGALPAKKFLWAGVDYYRPVKDEDGVPYCNAESLEPWAEYVASDEDGEAWQFESRPFAEEHGEWFGECKFTAAPHHDNTFQHWTETLRRVYRDPADGNNYRMSA